MENSAIKTWPVKKVKPEIATDLVEQLVVEEPLEIVLVYSTQNGRVKKSITVTLRTPGFDVDLATGFLFTEGVIKNIRQVHMVQPNRYDKNQVIVTLVENEMPVLDKIARHFYSTAACGLCGKVSVDDIQLPKWSKYMGRHKIPAELVYRFPEILNGRQEIFTMTGGLHAAALLNEAGEIIMVREDIGRHNAVDKVIGAALKSNIVLSGCILLLSGRAGFELVQKAAVAGIGMIAAMGAPSSLSVELASECGMTLVGFLKPDRFNIYCGAERIVTE